MWDSSGSVGQGYLSFVQGSFGSGLSASEKKLQTGDFVEKTGDRMGKEDKNELASFSWSTGGRRGVKEGKG